MKKTTFDKIRKLVLMESSANTLKGIKVSDFFSRNVCWSVGRIVDDM